MMSPLSVLIIDDDKDDIEFLSDAFKDHGTEVVTSFLQNAEEVISNLDSSYSQGMLPDVIISDLNMPKVNGLELIKWLKASDKYSSIPVFICSSSNLPRDRQLCLSAGAQGYIIKPVELSQYATLVNHVIKHLIEQS